MVLVAVWSLAHIILLKITTTSTITITNDIKRWLSIAMDSTDRIRILEGYLGGDRALEPVEALRSVDVDN
ncbi:hypothetical protein WAI453_012002 [Rhynchosporium graminicola]